MRFALFVTLSVGACGRIGFDVGGSSGVVALDSTGTSVIAASAMTNLELTTLEVGAGTDECLIAGLVLSNQSASGIDVRWNGAVLTAVTSKATAAGSGVVLVYRLIAPEVGIQTLRATWTGDSDAILGAVSLSGADQTECVRAVSADEGTSGTAQVTIASAPGHMTIDVSASTTAFGVATQTPRWMAATDGSPTLIQHAEHSAVSTVDTCTFAASPTAGHNLLFVGAAAASTLVSVSGAGVTWQAAGRSTANSNMEIWYGEATTGSGTTVTYTGTATSAMGCWLGELAGLAPTGSLDGTSANFGTGGMASPGPLVTTNARDLLVVGYSNFSMTTWDVPTQGPWTSLGEVANSGRSQVEFLQTVSSIGTWNPTIAKTSADMRWEAAASAFKISATAIGGALSTAPGGASVTHAWSTDATSAWASAGLDVFP